MLLVATRLTPSPVHGIGIFADTFIAKGTPVWKFLRGFDLELPLDFPLSLSEPARRQFLKYTYISPATGNYILCTDDARFFNHSDDPNVISTSVEGEQEGMDIAARDINAGEELLYDYRVFGGAAYLPNG
ncbi:MAG: SET domain-containing protein [Xanthobacteraceae bacterium]